MKHDLKRTLAPWLAAVILSQPCFAEDDPYAYMTVTPVPVVPQAYEPFQLDIVTPHPGPSTLSSFDIVKNEISIWYQRAEFSGLGSGRLAVALPGLAPGRYLVNTYWGGYYNRRSIEFDVASAPATHPVYTVYDPNDAKGDGTPAKRYFLVTPIPDMASRGTYIVVGDAFKAWPADGPAPATAKPVCHFYSDEAKSHFYTASESECASLKGNGAWRYEGIAFRALVPTARACPPGTADVWRLFNGRSELRDTNHRFVANEGVYRSMIADGWIGEGIAFCSPL